MYYDEELSLQQCKLREIDYPYYKYNQLLHQQYVAPRCSSEVEYPISYSPHRDKILLYEPSFKTKKVKFIGSQPSHFKESLLYKFITLPLSSPTEEIDIPNPYTKYEQYIESDERFSEFLQCSHFKSKRDIPLSEEDIEIIIDFTQKYSFPFVPYQVNNETLKNEPRSNYFEWFRECHSHFTDILNTGKTKHGTDLSYDEYLKVKEWFRLDANLQPAFLPPKRPKIRYSTLQPHFPFTRLVSLLIKMIETKQRSNKKFPPLPLSNCIICGDLAYVGQQRNKDWPHCNRSYCINRIKYLKRRDKLRSTWKDQKRKQRSK